MSTPLDRPDLLLLLARPHPQLIPAVRTHHHLILLRIPREPVRGFRRRTVLRRRRPIAPVTEIESRRLEVHEPRQPDPHRHDRRPVVKRPSTLLHLVHTQIVHAQPLQKPVAHIPTLIAQDIRDPAHAHTAPIPLASRAHPGRRPRRRAIDPAFSRACARDHDFVVVGEIDRSRVTRVRRDAPLDRHGRRVLPTRGRRAGDVALGDNLEVVVEVGRGRLPGCESRGAHAGELWPPRWLTWCSHV